MISLRPHHLFCIPLFRGAGYSAAFTENMKNTIARLKSGEKLKLISGADDLCAHCPNLEKDGTCALGADVTGRDSAVPVQPENAVTIKEAARLLLDVLDEARFQAVCGGCRWQGEGLCNCEALRASLEDFAR